MSVPKNAYSYPNLLSPTAMKTEPPGQRKPSLASAVSLIVRTTRKRFAFTTTTPREPANAARERSGESVALWE
jgi:hypothetical protein